MVYKVSITGTESTGKSTLAEQLAIHYKTIFVPDQSRIYIDELKGEPYTAKDVLAIAERIIEQEDLLFSKLANELRALAPPLEGGEVNKILFSDNDLINIKIWLEYYKWEVPAWLDEQIVKREPDLYLLCDIDIDWLEDDQRDKPNDRVTLLYRFINYLEALPANYKYVSGRGEERFEMAKKNVDAFLRFHDPLTP